MTIGYPSCTDPSIRTEKNCAHVLDSLVRTAKERRAVEPSARADACAVTSEPQLPSEVVGSRQVRLPRNWHACFDSLVHVSRHSRETCTHSENHEKIGHMLDSSVRVSQR